MKLKIRKKLQLRLHLQPSAMFAATVNSLRPIPPFHKSINPSFLFLHSRSLSTHSPKPISATLTPSTSTQQNLYQPFRPPPSPLPSQYTSLDISGRLEILSNRLGLWFEYAALIPFLMREGFTPSSIEEATGITGVEQNRLIVASQVRESLVHSGTDPEVISSFDTGGAELLYEIRLLSVNQRTAAVKFILANGLDAQGAQELARSMKDFPRRRGDKGWDKFDYTLPGDCLSFMYLRQSGEHANPSQPRTTFLEEALRVAESEMAKKIVAMELERGGDDKEKEGGLKSEVRVPVVRLKMGEVAEATTVVLLPVCRGEERDKEIADAPWESKSEGAFGVVVAEKEWRRWVVLPRWEPLVGLGRGGVAVALRDARALPWKVKRWYKEEPILVVLNRERKEIVADEGFYMTSIDDKDGNLKVERGRALKERGVRESLGTVVLVVRPDRDDDDDQIKDEEWD